MSSLSFASCGIVYTVGDATVPNEQGQKIIVHCCNDIGVWGAGFVLALGSRYPKAKTAYLEWFDLGQHLDASGPPVLGAVQLVRVADDTQVVNLIGQRGVGGGKSNPPIRYEAIRAGLKKVASLALKFEASVHMPRMGSGLAGGSWNAIEQIVEDELSAYGISVVVYDFRP